MKYLKTFENKKFYHTINYIEFSELKNNTSLSFSDKEINYLKMISSYEDGYKFEVIKDIFNSNVEIVEMCRNVLGRDWSSPREVDRCYKLEDEWYIIHFFQHKGSVTKESYYFKCDQWEGLLQCLGDIGYDIK